ncbi:MAG: dihydrolipoyllysine-residue succinyltransferase [Verrucomicrobia bacterium]|nr:MAG: dihydrolipoyllysine-residue succinyltransferase [Verrucomicrobiota bacterium]TAE85808.1 MAG: dihydrolipoyllysine-residue succinyltransferase [Verrucomicrobiota bacterium]TAF23229.1 MAG: dihydrolipoyllysine-residue succinyltransferase [Verrucomicrobiota bacterium]TAF40058.1 MAG: dihydrolipoyllysine-residue succinyltransferase [Verrucomicrobiota bacterium]
MSLEVKVPAAGESITSANVARWHKPEGSSVRKGEVLVTLETDKVSTELEAPADGVLRIVVAEGEEVAIGTVIALLDEVAAAVVASPAAAPVAAAPAAVGAVQVLDVKVPAAGESITSANVARWHKGDGSAVNKGEVLVTLETDKVSSELEAEASGTLKILVPEGNEVSIGTLIARISVGAGAAAAPVASSPAPVAVAPAPAPIPVAAPVNAPKPRNFELPAAPSTPATAASAPVSDGRSTRRKMSMLRRKISTHLVNAQQTAAILTTFNEADMSAVMDLRKAVQEEFLKKHGVKLGFMSFFVKAVVQALKDVPQVNGMIDGQDIVENHFYDIGVAIGTEKGLIVPVIRDADKKSFAQIEQDILDYAKKAKDGKIAIEDLQGGVFTISNGGTYGSLLSTPILNPPQSGILGMHTIQQRPVALNNQVVIRPMMYLALSYDHRLVDGKEAVTFLIRIKDCIENPTRLMLEM